MALYPDSLYDFPNVSAYDSDLREVLAMLRGLTHEMRDFKVINKITNAGAWDITKQYKPWTVVSDNNIGYISVRPVPAGIEITNPDYWALVADYDILITNLSERISALEEAMHERYIFIGDSYGERTAFSFDVWSKIVPEDLMGLTEGVDYWYKCVSGAGFAADGYKFLTGLQYLSTSILNKDSITDIYVFGGVNDYNKSQSAIETAIEGFMTYAKANYRNATVHIGHVSNNGSGIIQNNMHDNTLPAYSNCGKYGAEYVPLQDVLCNLDYLGSDLSHPTADGQILLSSAIFNAIKGSQSFTKNSVTRTLLPVTGASLWPETNVNFIEFEENGFYTAYFPGPWLQIAFPSPIAISVNGTHLMTLDARKGVFPKSGYKWIQAPVKLKINGTYDTYARMLTLKLDFVNSKITAFADYVGITNVDAVIIYPFEITNTTFGSW